MTSGESKSERREAFYRLVAAQRRVAAARADLNAECVRAARAFNAFSDAYIGAEIREVQQHPDLALLDAQLNGFYGPVGEAE